MRACGAGSPTSWGILLNATHPVTELASIHSQIASSRPSLAILELNSGGIQVPMVLVNIVYSFFARTLFITQRAVQVTMFVIVCVCCQAVIVIAALSPRNCGPCCCVGVHIMFVLGILTLHLESRR